MIGFARFLRYAFVLLGLVALLWFLGLELFVSRIASYESEMAATDRTAASADAIVALTGGSERIETALTLLKSGAGRKLLISGVSQGTTLDHLIGKQDVPASLRQCCITIGHLAETTRGNAVETRDWMHHENLRSLILVTANYHMPRSLVLFRAAMPDTPITPHPVTPDGVKLYGWWYHVGTANLLVTEYMKYLAVFVQ